ncbi:MAG: hypothetical protein B7Z08_09760 [Sphingomonadales bacterium 32-68-7]|nr:MAG: hypothetical protein B7Z33_00150 [Sphingomonadales bacterium 12-68-11]OYX08345.1 MAG: hypothetical protein B7Z08_09760 [Sphingomonadales bacterium 32-68-7]
MDRRLTIVVALAALGLFYAFGLRHIVSIEGLQTHIADLTALYRENPGWFVAGFVLLISMLLAMCLPAVVLTPSLAAGALFGQPWGTLIMLATLTIGDSLGFLVARYLLRDWAERRFARHMTTIDRGVERDGAFYLLALRLSAVVPYFVVNVGMALTRMPIWIYAPVSLIGLAPVTFLYVSAGEALMEIRSADDILSLRLLLVLGALGLLPLIMRLAFRRRLAD